MSHLKRYIFCFSVLLFQSACGGVSYFCTTPFDSKEFFSWNSSGVQQGSHFFYFSSPFTKKYKENLTASDLGGTYNISVTDSYVSLKYIQDTVYTKMLLPSGTMIEARKEQSAWNGLYAKKYDSLYIYHGVFPVIYSYQFDKVEKNLIYTKLALEPRSFKKLSYKRGANGGRARLVDEENLGSHYAKKIFPDRLNKERRSVFKDCEREATVPSFFRSLIRSIFG